jgi:hypothetical protein
LRRTAINARNASRASASVLSLESFRYKLNHERKGRTSAWMDWRVIAKASHAEVWLIVEWLASGDTDAESQLGREGHND